VDELLSYPKKSMFRTNLKAAWERRGQKGDCGMDSATTISSITPVVLESKPTDNVLTVSAYKTIISDSRHGVKVELVDADLGDILEQIGFDRIFDYWSLSLVREEVERYARQHPEDEPPMAS
jgi:hypothetical protein